MIARLKAQKLVIGHTLEALQFAQDNGAVVLINEQQTPHPIENPKEWKEWHRLTFLLGMRGLSPIPSDTNSIRIEEGCASVSTEAHRVIKINFEELHIFDTSRVQGLGIETKVLKFLVYDWFDIKRGAKQSINKLVNDDEFVRELCFYPSLRKDGNNGSIKDCYTKSYINSEDLEKFEYSETAARFAAMRLIKENNLTGPSRKFGDKVHHLNLVLKHSRRELYEHTKKYIINESLPKNIFLL